MPTNGLPAFHPGEFIREILADLDMPESELAAAVGVDQSHISAVLRGEKPVTAELALLLARALDQSPHYWLNLQAEYDLKITSARMGSRLARVHAIRQAPQP